MKKAVFIIDFGVVKGQLSHLIHRLIIGINGYSTSRARLIDLYENELYASSLFLCQVEEFCCKMPTLSK